MVEERKGYQEAEELTLTAIELKVNQKNDELIDKITFRSKEKDITWKPKITKQTFRDGFKVSETIQMEYTFLPEKLKEMAKIVQEQGSVKVKASYSWWETEADGSKVIYRFINATSVFDKWVIVKAEPEKV